MGENAKKQRNQTIDVIRGIAIFLVVIGHLVTNNTTGAEGTPFYNVIWSLQMPLFFLLSGYVNRYQKPIDSAKSLFKYIGKRAVAYILPWFTCAIIIRSLAMFGFGFAVDKVKEVVWHLDSGYWFLWTLWFVCLMHGVASYVACKVSKSRFSGMVTTCVSAVVLALIPLAVGIKISMNFFAIKLLLYYLPFYYLGYVVSQLDCMIEESKKDFDKLKAFKHMVYLPVLVIYIYFVWNYDLYQMTEGVINNVLRILASLAGCFVVCSFAGKIKGTVAKILDILGRYSIEIYILHYLFLSRIVVEPLPALTSPEGVIACLINLVLALIFTTIFVFVMSVNKYSKFLCFGKRK